MKPYKFDVTLDKQYSNTCKESQVSLRTHWNEVLKYSEKN